MAEGNLHRECRSLWSRSLALSRRVEESSLQARRGNRRAWDLTAQAREQHLGALSCKENPPAGVIPQALGGWGSRLAGLLLTAASRSKDLAPPRRPRKRASLYAIGTRRGVPTARAHKRQPTREEGPGPLCPRLYLMIHEAVPHDTPGSAFSRRHRGARPRLPASRCC